MSTPDNERKPGEPVAWEWRSKTGGWCGFWQVTLNYATIEWKLPSHYEVCPLVPLSDYTAEVARREAVERERDEAMETIGRCTLKLPPGQRGDIDGGLDLSKGIARLRARAEGAEAEARQIRLALAWLDHHEPELVAAAEEKFGFRLTRDEARAALASNKAGE